MVKRTECNQANPGELVIMTCFLLGAIMELWGVVVELLTPTLMSNAGH